MNNNLLKVKLDHPVAGASCHRAGGWAGVTMGRGITMKDRQTFTLIPTGTTTERDVRWC